MNIPNTYIGTVIANDDPEHAGRVKVRIEGINSSIRDGTLAYKYPAGQNIPGALSPDEIELSRVGSVWAIVVSPAIGESSMGKYNRTYNVASPADTLSPDGMTKGTNPQDIEGRQTPMGAQFERISDKFSAPSVTKTSKANPYSYSYIPQLYPNAGKGSFSVLGIGTKVIVGFLHGSYRDPVVYGILNTKTEYSQIFNGDNNYPGYPGIFENTNAISTQ
jgi:hypothetical protein